MSNVALLHPGAVLTERRAHLGDFEGIIETPITVRRTTGTIDGLTTEDAGRFLG